MAPLFDALTVDRPTLLRMLMREQQLRDSDATQDAYDEFHRRLLPAPEAIEMCLQRRVLRESGFRDDDDGLAEWWRVNKSYPLDDAIRSTTVYMKFNITQPLRVAVGDAALDAKVFQVPLPTAAQVGADRALCDGACAVPDADACMTTVPLGAESTRIMTGLARRRLSYRPSAAALAPSSLLSFANPGRPLVVAAGSWS